MKNIYLSLFATALFTSCGVESIVTSTPLVKTFEPQHIQNTTVELGGEVFNDAGSFVTERGVVLSTTNAVPTINDIKKISGRDEGEFYDLLDGLLDNTTYYYRAFGTNDMGAGYGETISFTTLPTACTPSEQNRFYINNNPTDVGGVVKLTNWAIYDNGNMQFYTQTGNNNVITLQFYEAPGVPLPLTGTYSTTQLFVNSDTPSDFKVKVYVSQNGQPNSGTLAPDGEFVFVNNNNGVVTFTLCDANISSSLTVNGLFIYQ
jgi:hypothetical protein